MTASATTNAKIYVGTTTAIDFTTDAGAIDDFEADTWKEVKNVEDLGEFGDESNEISYGVIGEGRMFRLKGARDAGTIALVCVRDAFDDGQRALIAAEKTSHDYNFKVEVGDDPAGGTPTIYYFRALVMSAKNAFGGVGDVVKTAFNIGVNSAILEVVATEATP